MSFSLRVVAWMAFAVAVVLLIGSSVLLYRATTRQRAGDSLVAHTHQVETVIEDLGSEVFKASNSRRAFIITGNESLLGGYHSAVQNIPQGLAHLRRLTSDSAERQRELDTIHVKPLGGTTIWLTSDKLFSSPFPVWTPKLTVVFDVVVDRASIAHCRVSPAA